MADEPKKTSRRNYSDPGLPALGRSTWTAVSLFATALGLPDPTTLFGSSLLQTLRREVDYVRVKVHALEAKRLVSHRYLKSEGFALRLNEIVSQLVRTAQEEKRRYLCHGLLHLASGQVDEDDATLLLPLVEALSLRHMVVIRDLVEHVRFSDTGSKPHEGYDDVRPDAVWPRVALAFHQDGREERLGKHIFEAVLADLEGRGLIERTWSAFDMQPNRALMPSELARRLVAFVADPLESSVDDSG